MVQFQYVVCRIEECEYAIDIMNITEITEFRLPIKIPSTPVYIEGVLNVRGIVIPIINLKKRLQLIENEIKENSKIVICSLNENQVGFIVDDASQVMTLKEEDITFSPELFDEAHKKNLLKSIAKVNDKLIILLDLFEFFKTEEKHMKKTKVG